MSKELSGKVIAENRKRLKMTQAVLADKLSVTVAAVSKWERGESYPDIFLCEELCRILNISAEELFTGKKPAYVAALSEKMKWLISVTVIVIAVLSGCLIADNKQMKPFNDLRHGDPVSDFYMAADYNCYISEDDGCLVYQLDDVNYLKAGYSAGRILFLYKMHDDKMVDILIAPFDGKYRLENQEVFIRFDSDRFVLEGTKDLIDQIPEGVKKIDRYVLDQWKVNGSSVSFPVENGSICFNGFNSLSLVYEGEVYNFIRWDM